jgi:hypothetical protein
MGPEHDCCSCYETKVPKDLRELLDWKARFDRGLAQYKAGKVTAEQFAYFASKGSEPPAPEQAEKQEYCDKINHTWGPDTCYTCGLKKPAPQGGEGKP